MATITFYDVSDADDALLRTELALHPDWDVQFVNAALSTESASLARDSQVISVFTGSRVTADLLSLLPALRLITTRSTGFDHVDLAAATQRGITVCNVPAYGAITVAEYTLALLLALMRRLAPTWRRCARGDFSRNGLMGHDLHGKTLGVVGTGRIGKHVVQLAHAFGMRIIAHDPCPNPELVRAYAVTYMELEQLLPQADALTLHAPYQPSTHHLLNEARLRSLRPGVVVVNTSRGGLIDSHALLQLHASGHFGGLALDCFEGEEVWLNLSPAQSNDLPGATLVQAIDSFQLQCSGNVILTPHNAFNTAEALARIASTTIENIAAFFANQPVNPVGRPPC